jgi:hypothetical protein
VKDVRAPMPRQFKDSERHKMKKDYAFPHSRLDRDCDGITIRQYFAAKAMHALLLTEYKGPKAVYQGWEDALAHESFFIADAMIKKSSEAS